MLNLEVKHTYHIFDDCGLPVIRGSKDSWRDSIGRAVMMWLAYDRNSDIEIGLESCLKWEGDKFVLYRHPHVIGAKEYKNDISKDHWSYFLMYRKLDFDAHDFNEFVSDTPIKLGLRSWVGALQGKKLSTLWYYSFQIVGNWLGNGWNSFWRAVGNIKKERTNEWWAGILHINTDGYVLTNGHNLQVNLSRWQKLIRRLLIPNYPQHNKGWQLYALPDHPLKKRLKKILLKRIYNRGGYSNYLLRLLFGDTTVTEEDVQTYRHMTGYRWGTNLDETCLRDVYYISNYETEFNDYEVDLLEFLFYQLQESKD